MNEYYKQQRVQINLDIDFNDGCATQFKSIKSDWLFANRKVQTERIYFESSHGKGPSNGLGGMVKSVTTSAVCAEKLIIRNGKELHTFLEERCTLENDPEILRSKHCIMKRKFFLIEMDKINSFRKNLGKLPFKTYKGTQLLHQITCHRSIKSYQLMLRKYACLCEPCVQLHGECENYASLDSFVVRKTVNLPLKNGHEQSDDDEDDEEFDEEHGVWEWENSEAVQMIQPNDAVVIGSDDSFNSYYLIKTMTEVVEIYVPFTDDYGHTFPIGHTIVKGHYLEVLKRFKNTTYLYEDVTKTVSVSSYCIVGIAPSLPICDGKRKRQVIKLYEINREVDEILLGLVTGYTF